MKKAGVNKPTKDELSLLTVQRLRDLDQWVKEELKKAKVKVRFARNIDALCGLFQKRIIDLVKDVDCDASHLSRVKNGKAVASFLVLNGLARALGTTAQILLEVDIAKEFQAVLDKINQA